MLPGSKVSRHEHTQHIHAVRAPAPHTQACSCTSKAAPAAAAGKPVHCPPAARGLQVHADDPRCDQDETCARGDAADGCRGGSTLKAPVSAHKRHTSRRSADMVRCASGISSSTTSPQSRCPGACGRRAMRAGSSERSSGAKADSLQQYPNAAVGQRRPLIRRSARPRRRDEGSRCG